MLDRRGRPWRQRKMGGSSVEVCGERKPGRIDKNGGVCIGRPVKMETFTDDDE